MQTRPWPRIRFLFLLFLQKRCFVNIVRRSIWAAVWKVMIAFEQKPVKLKSLRGTHYFLALLLLELSWKKGKTICRQLKISIYQSCIPANSQTKENTYLIFLTHAKTPNACFYTESLILHSVWNFTFNVLL